MVGTDSTDCSSSVTSPIHEDANITDSISRYFMLPKIHIIISFLLSLPDN